MPRTKSKVTVTKAAPRVSPLPPEMKEKLSDTVRCGSALFKRARKRFGSEATVRYVGEVGGVAAELSYEMVAEWSSSGDELLYPSKWVLRWNARTTSGLVSYYSRATGAKLTTAVAALVRGMEREIKQQQCQIAKSRELVRDMKRAITDLSCKSTLRRCRNPKRIST